MSDWPFWNRIRSHDPGRAAYIDVATGATLTYGELVSRVLASPAPSQRRVMLQSKNTLDFAPRFLSALLHGWSVFTTSPDVPPMEFDRAARRTENLSPTPEGELLLCSSGTTGLPKIVRRSRRSLDAVAVAMADAIGHRAADRVIAAVPLVHSYGIEHGLLSPLWAGCTVLLCDGLNLPHITQAIEQGATIFPTVPSIIELLSQTADERLLKHRLRRVYAAGAPLPPSVSRAFAQKFNIQVGQVYGLTEVGSVLYNDPGRDAPTSVGRPAAHVSVRILAMDNSTRVLAAGEEGEVAIKSDSMLDAYVEEELRLIDGHFPTGDLGRLQPSGELMLTGRIRLLIDVGGAKVNPLEVEQILNEHPQIRTSVVLGLRLSETVQKIRAIVVPTDIVNPPSAADLRDFARARLAAYKIPRQIEFRDTLPRTATGKVLRHLLETP